MASIGFLIGGALINALAFSGSNFLFSSLSKDQSIKNERDLSFMLVLLTRFYLSFNALLIECHKHFHLAWEYNRAVSAKQGSLCKDVYRAHDNSKWWPLLNFHELQTEEFPDFSLLSKNPLKLNKSKMNHIISIILCRNEVNTTLRQLSSESQYNYVVQAVLRCFNIL